MRVTDLNKTKEKGPISTCSELDPFLLLSGTGPSF